MLCYASIAESLIWTQNCAEMILYYESFLASSIIYLTLYAKWQCYVLILWVNVLPIKVLFTSDSFQQQKTPLSQAYFRLETLWHVIVSAKKRKWYNDSYLNFIFLFHFPVIVNRLYSPWLTVTLSWHAEDTWMVDCETWYNNFLPCFWFYGKVPNEKWPPRNGLMWMTHRATII